MKLLTVAIPTYNRPAELEELYTSFISPALNEFGADIDVVICDNSEGIAAEQNSRFSRAPGIRYLLNGRNIGFAGNVLKCISAVNGRFAWVISDNDKVEMPGFRKFIEALRQADADGISCLMLPFRTLSPLDRPIMQNTPEEWHVIGDCTVSELLARGGALPFILFSSAAIRVPENVLALLPEIERDFGNNDFLQIPLFISMLGGKARVRFADVAVQEYRAEYDGRFDYDGLHRSFKQVSVFAAAYGADPQHLLAKYYRGSLIWTLHQRLGLYRARGRQDLRALFLAELPSHLNLKNIVLALLLYLPRPLVKWPYLFWQCRTNCDVEGQGSWRTVVSDMRLWNRQLTRGTMPCRKL